MRIRTDRLFLLFLIAIGFWMAWYDWHDPADLVAREFISVLGGLSGLYVLVSHAVSGARKNE